MILFVLSLGMDINLSEQRELADYIARKLIQGFYSLADSDEQKAASIIWDAIEDYTGTPDPTPDPEDMGRADDFADHYFTRSD